MKMTRSEAKQFVEDPESWTVVEQGNFTRCSMLTFEGRAWMKIERMHCFTAYSFESRMKEEKRTDFSGGMIYCFDPELMATTYGISKTQLIDAIIEACKDSETKKAAR